MVGNDISVKCCQIHWPQKEERTKFRIVNLSLSLYDVNVTAITQNRAKNGTS